jgi:hypothetical protein
VSELTAGSFTESAREFAMTALDAHFAGDFRRVALDAGTALEHLAKACLASRSPALLTELRSEGNFASLLVLLGIPAIGGAGPIRTVGLRDALARVRKLVPSTAPVADLGFLTDMRDGTVHAAADDEVEERLVVAFVQHCDALLTDLKADRSEFWGRQLRVVDALLADAGDMVAHHVAVKLAAARARLDARAVAEHPEMLKLARQLAASRSYFEWETAPEYCPVCEDTTATVTGVRDVGYDYEDDVSGWPVREAMVFRSQKFACAVCGLRLDSPAEIEEAGLAAEVEENYSSS